MNNENKLTRPSRSTGLLPLDRQLKILAANFRVELTELQAVAYREGLKDLTPEERNRGFESALKECPDFMPTVGKLRSFALAGEKRAADDRVKLEAERGWEMVLVHVNRYGATVYPGDSKLVLCSAGEYAFRRIGWRYGLVNTAPEDLHWAHKEFVAAFMMHAETGGLLAPSREEARRLLAGLDGEMKQLAAGVTGAA